MIIVEDENIYRLKWVSKIKNKWVRRILLLITFPILFSINCAFATAAAPLFVLICWWENNEDLFRSALLRWNVPKDDN